MPEHGGKSRETKTRKGIQWEDIAEKAYERLSWYATRFMIIATVGVVIGVIALVYAALMMFLFGAELQDLNVFLGAFVGIGSIAINLCCNKFNTCFL